MWELLEDACTILDFKLAVFNSGGHVDPIYTTALTEMMQLTDKMKQLKQVITVLDDLVAYFSVRLPNPSRCPSLATVRKEAANKKAEARKIVGIVREKGSYSKHSQLQAQEIKKHDELLKEKFKPRDGPFLQSLSKALTALDVLKQAYQGGTFVGNHVHKLLKVLP